MGFLPTTSLLLSSPHWSSSLGSSARAGTSFILGGCWEPGLHSGTRVHAWCTT